MGSGRRKKKNEKREVWSSLMWFQGSFSIILEKKDF